MRNRQALRRFMQGKGSRPRRSNTEADLTTFKTEL